MEPVQLLLYLLSQGKITLENFRTIDKMGTVIVMIFLALFHDQTTALMFKRLLSEAGKCFFDLDRNGTYGYFALMILGLNLLPRSFS